MVSGGRPVVLVFGASWCKRCAELAPFCKGLAAKMADAAAFASVDIDEAEDLTLTPTPTPTPTLTLTLTLI